MENSQTADTKEALNAMQQYIQATFKSENEMKEYYLQMSNVICPAYNHFPLESEYNRLKRLNAKLKQYCTFIQTLGDHEWERGVADIQKAMGIYLMQSDIDRKVRQQTNQEIASQLQFIVFLSGNINIVKQLQGIFTHHSSNVTYLLKSISVDS
ncbi:hypothetical protein [Bacteroides sp. GM023]|uniref:hypothetical protein n=1 Tax=Bacteroides sp. GM023 TaxID=2723058 RepID=UPI00168B742A|nr:hypothetical protein [Bacteroides sp. GM023]MBD3592749.1 hypothetical protein [Bacteroides sp. GM023]